jgi:hypothetical protein
MMIFSNKAVILLRHLNLVDYTTIIKHIVNIKHRESKCLSSQFNHY